MVGSTWFLWSPSLLQELYFPYMGAVKPKKNFLHAARTSKKRKAEGICISICIMHVSSGFLSVFRKEVRERVGKFVGGGGGGGRWDHFLKPPLKSARTWRPNYFSFAVQCTAGNLKRRGPRFLESGRKRRTAGKVRWPLSISFFSLARTENCLKRRILYS